MYSPIIPRESKIKPEKNSVVVFSIKSNFVELRPIRKNTLFGKKELLKYIDNKYIFKPILGNYSFVKSVARNRPLYNYKESNNR